MSTSSSLGDFFFFFGIELFLLCPVLTLGSFFLVLAFSIGEDDLFGGLPSSVEEDFLFGDFSYFQSSELGFSH